MRSFRLSVVLRSTLEIKRRDIRRVVSFHVVRATSFCVGEFRYVLICFILFCFISSCFYMAHLPGVANVDDGDLRYVLVDSVTF